MAAIGAEIGQGNGKGAAAGAFAAELAALTLQDNYVTKPHEDDLVVKLSDVIGAVPVLMPHQKGKSKFSLFGELSFNEDEVISLLERFIEHLWSSEIQPAMYYVMDSGLPTILTMANDGSYSRAMVSMEDMESFVKHLTYQFNQMANMDW